MLGKTVRKVFRVGSSLVITLPAEYVEAHKLKPGCLVEVVFNDVVKIVPVREEDIERELMR